MHVCNSCCNNCVSCCLFCKPERCVIILEILKSWSDSIKLKLRFSNFGCCISIGAPFQIILNIIQYFIGFFVVVVVFFFFFFFFFFVDVVVFFFVFCLFVFFFWGGG